MREIMVLIIMIMRIKLITVMVMIITIQHIKISLDSENFERSVSRASCVALTFLLAAPFASVASPVDLGLKERAAV